MFSPRSRFSASLGLTVLAIAVLSSSPRCLADDPSFLDRFNTVNLVASTVPGNGDENPYGIVFVRRSVGSLKKGHVLVSNFNNSTNVQGTGTTIMQISPEGTPSLFAMIDPGDPMVS